LIPNISESLENYLRAIYILHIDGKIPRIKDISKILSVKDASSVDAIKRLEKTGYVKHERYGYVILTDKGLLTAEKVYRRYIILIDFFVNILGLSKEEAYNLACGVEHHMNDKFYISLDGLILFLRRNPIEFAEAKNFIQKYIKKMPHDFKNTLWSLNKEEIAEVYDISGESSLRKLIIDKGIFPGLLVKITNKYKNSIEFLANDKIINLNQNEAEHIIIGPQNIL
jgi:DtxR family Mn-dependent transcriptional regulator